MLTTILLVYLGGFVALEAESVKDYASNENQIRVLSRGEKLFVDTASNSLWIVTTPVSLYTKLKD